MAIMRNGGESSLKAQPKANEKWRNGESGRRSMKISGKMAAKYESEMSLAKQAKENNEISKRS